MFTEISAFTGVPKSGNAIHRYTLKELDMKISIFGLGYVGCVSLGCLAQNGFTVIGVDVNATKVELINKGLPTIIEHDIDRIIREQRALGRISATLDQEQAVMDSDVTIICVGTPSTASGHLNLDYIYQTAEQIGEALKMKGSFHTVVIRSTVLPGTNAKVGEIIEQHSGKLRNQDFAVVSNPEFLREGTAVQDYYNPPFTLVGADNAGAVEVMRELYSKVQGEFVEASIPAAELIKYVNNSYHALKVVFANEVGNVCKQLSMDSHEVMKLFCLDRQLNISTYYFKPGFAYGGSCLPKDLKALVSLACDKRVEAPVLQAIEHSNQEHIKMAADMVLARSGKTTGILGVSFKEGTDDLRYSPMLSVITILLARGRKVWVHDENVNAAILTGSNKDYLERNLPFLGDLLLPTQKELVDRSDLVVLNRRTPNFQRLLQENPGKHFLDFVRQVETVSLSNYEGICW